jgi:hypothetical protein
MTKTDPGALLVTDREQHWYAGFRAADLIRYLAEHAGEINAGDVERIEFHFAGPGTPSKPKIVHRLPPVVPRGA